MSEHKLLTEEVGHTEFLMGNEAIARGAVEAGVGFACGYPGTPSTEVTDSLAALAPHLGIPFEYSVNEKIALEMAFAASLAGTRSIVAMKHLGLMYAGDPLATIPYVGVRGGMVIVSAGDPSCHTSPNEQDQRHLADALHIPMLDPRTPQEALEATRFAFELSEESRLPVIVRPTTRVCHTAAPVTFGAVAKTVPASFRRDPGALMPVPTNARRMRVEINDRLQTARKAIEQTPLYGRVGTSGDAVIAIGAPAAICAELLTDDRVSLLSLGVVYPLPEEWLVAQLADLETVVVVEELSPYLEDRLRALCALHGLSPRILGKRTGHFPMEFEYDPTVIAPVLHEVFGMGSPQAAAGTAPRLPTRAPALCAGCPHRSAFFAARSVFGDEALYFNDIGCYTLGAAPPLGAGDASLAMGAGFTLAAGVARTTRERTLGFLGDSTFFHSGMPALLNAIKENVNMVAVIMDNQVTAMTGFQERPGIEVDESGPHSSVDIEAVVRALGARHVETFDPNDLAASFAAFERARDRDQLTVLISQRICPLFEERVSGAASGPLSTYTIDHDRCAHCGRSECGMRCDQGVVAGFERAMVRARSLETGSDVARPAVAPCATACPLYLCIQGYAAHIAAGRYGDALELIMSGLPLPDTVCRVCHRPCEEVCVRAAVDAPVAINDLKRFVMDWAAAQDEAPYVPQPGPPNGMQVAVVGAGPAGLAASHDLAMRGYRVDLFDAADEPGGLLRRGIPRYRLPKDVLRRDVQRILDLGVNFCGGRRLGADLVLDDLVGSHDAVLVAVGAGLDLTLDLPGSGPDLVVAGDFLGNGTAAEGEQVVVIGGGNSAIDAARTAVRRGAAGVLVACIEERDAMPAIGSEIAAAEEEGVVIRDGTRPVALVPDGVELAEGGFVAADRVVLAIGHDADEGILTGSSLELGWDEGLAADAATGATNHDRVFSAGDLAGEERTVTSAIASGLRAAWGIDRSLRGADAAAGRLPPPRVAPGPDRLGVTRRDAAPRREPRHLDPRLRRTGFAEVVGALTETQARAEAGRCMICGLCGNCNSCLDLFGCPAFYVADGRIEIDPGLCTACGVCAQLCPNGAIVPVTAAGAAV